MPTASQIQTAVNNRLATLWSVIQTRQAAFHAVHGRYWQGLISHTIIPADAIETALDRAGLHPTTQAEAWAAFFGAELPATLPMAIRIDTYTTPLGDGFVGTVWVRDTARAVTYTRAAQVGPATGFAYGWRAL